jgi:predicted transcriptional regulator
MKKLTQAEEQIMHVLWSLKLGGYMKEKKLSLFACLK